MNTFTTPEATSSLGPVPEVGGLGIDPITGLTYVAIGAVLYFGAKAAGRGLNKVGRDTGLA